MDNPLDTIGKALDSKLVNKTYDDAIHKSALTVGNAIAGVIRFVALPFTFLGMTAKQLEIKYEAFIREAINNVPEEKRVLPQPAIASTVLDRVKFVFDDNNLRTLYGNLLSKSMNSDYQNDLHISFAYILSEISPYEARLLERINSNPKMPLVEMRVYDINELQKKNTDIFEYVISSQSMFDCVIDYGHPIDSLDNNNTALSNLNRLGITNASTDNSFPSIEVYKYFSDNYDIYNDYCKSVYFPSEVEVFFYKGALTLTPYGKKFIKAIL